MPGRGLLLPKRDLESRARGPIVCRRLRRIVCRSPPAGCSHECWARQALAWAVRCASQRAPSAPVWHAGFPAQPTPELSPLAPRNYGFRIIPVSQSVNTPTVRFSGRMAISCRPVRPRGSGSCGAGCQPAGDRMHRLRRADRREAGDAEDFRLYLVGEKLAPTTVHKRLQFARQGHADHSPLPRATADLGRGFRRSARGGGVRGR